MNTHHPQPACRMPMARTILAFVMALSSMALPGCQATKAVLAAPKPSASLRYVRFTGITNTGASMAFDVDVINPYALPLPLANMNYKVSSGGKQLVSGRADLQGTIPAHESKTVTLPAEIKFADASWIITSVTPGSVIPYDAELGLSMNAPEVGPITLNLRNIQGQLPIPTAPAVTLTGIKWDSLSLDQAKATMNLQVMNRNQFAFVLNKVNYALTLGDVAVAKAGVNDSMSFSAGGANQMSVPLSFSPKSLGVSVFNMLTGRGSQYQVKGELNCTSPYGPMVLPFEQSGQTVFSH